MHKPRLQSLPTPLPHSPLLLAPRLQFPSPSTAFLPLPPPSIAPLLEVPAPLLAPPRELPQTLHFLQPWLPVPAARATLAGPSPLPLPPPYALHVSLLCKAVIKPVRSVPLARNALTFLLWPALLSLTFQCFVMGSMVNMRQVSASQQGQRTDLVSKVCTFEGTC